MKISRISPPLKKIYLSTLLVNDIFIYKYFDQKILYPYKTKILEEWEYLVTSYMMLWFTIYC